MFFTKVFSQSFLVFFHMCPSTPETWKLIPFQGDIRRGYTKTVVELFRDQVYNMGSFLRDLLYPPFQCSACCLLQYQKVNSEIFFHPSQNCITYPRYLSQALGPGALGRPRGSGWRGRWEGGSGWGTHVNPWLFHLNV